MSFLDINKTRMSKALRVPANNPARMHLVTVLSPKYEAMLGERGGKDWGVNEAGMKQMTTTSATC